MATLNISQVQYSASNYPWNENASVQDYPNIINSIVLALPNGVQYRILTPCCHLIVGQMGFKVYYIFVVWFVVADGELISCPQARARCCWPLLLYRASIYIVPVAHHIHAVQINTHVIEHRHTRSYTTHSCIKHMQYEHIQHAHTL